jgi:hypothetical protein
MNTKEIMTRKHFYVEYDKCVFCDQNIFEDVRHLFFECDFTRNFWWKLSHEWNGDLPLTEMISDGKQRNSLLYFNDSVIIGSWSIWNHRNGIIFLVTGILKYVLVCPKVTSLRLFTERNPAYRRGMQDLLDLL